MKRNKTKKYLFKIATTILVLCTILVSCNEYNEVDHEMMPIRHKLTLNMPFNIKNATLTQSEATLTNIQSGKQYTIDNFKAIEEGYVANHRQVLNVALCRSIYHAVLDQSCDIRVLL